MRINRLSIFGKYKNIQTGVLVLSDNNYTALVGANGSGKSNWIEIMASIMKRNLSQCSSYKAALRKEEGREHLLKGKLGINEVKHYVISRYPVISDNERVIPFNRLDEWCKAM